MLFQLTVKCNQAKSSSVKAVDFFKFCVPSYRDIVKLTAQFVARNGRQFLTSLMNREQRNYHFDFLRPQHSMFTYFTKLVEQYTKVKRVSKESQWVEMLPIG